MGIVIAFILSLAGGLYYLFGNWGIFWAVVLVFFLGGLFRSIGTVAMALNEKQPEESSKTGAE